MAKTNEQFDQIFREKLENFREKPSALAWERLESQLPQQPKSNKGFWWAIAASMTALLVASYLFWPKSGGLTEENLLAEIPQEQLIQEAQTESPLDQISESVPAEAVTLDEKTGDEKAENKPQQPENQNQSKQQTKPTLSPSKVQTPQNLTAQAETITPEPVKPLSRPDLIAEIPVVSLPETTMPLAGEQLAEAKTSETEEPLYRISIYSDGIKKEEPKDKNLITELGKTVGQVEGLLGKVDTGFADLQDAKNSLFASLTSKKERAEQKP
jgi:hypothetical protein